MTYAEYLNTMTVKTLREIGKQMGLSFPAKALKGSIVNALTEDINSAHSEALEMNEAQKSSETVYVMDMTDGSQVEFTGLSAKVLIRHEVNVKRYNPSMSKGRDGKVKLTPRQNRRINKKLKHYAKSIGFFEGAMK